MCFFCLVTGANKQKKGYSSILTSIILYSDLGGSIFSLLAFLVQHIYFFHHILVYHIASSIIKQCELHVGTITKSIFRLPVLRSLSPYPGIIILNSKYSRIRENCTVSFMSTYLWMSFTNASVFKFSFFSNLRFLNSLDVSLQPQI